MKLRARWMLTLVLIIVGIVVVYNVIGVIIFYFQGGN